MNPEPPRLHLDTNPNLKLVTFEHYTLGKWTRETILTTAIDYDRTEARMLTLRSISKQFATAAYNPVRNVRIEPAN
jgi:hypothetical protein